MINNQVFIDRENKTENEFRENLEKFVVFARKWGFELTAHSELTWKKFRSLSSVLQKEINESFRSYFNICLTASNEGIGLDDDRALVWYAIKYLCLRPSSDLFDKLSKGDIIEVYNTENIQIFRNIRFFEITSYTLGDIFTHPWTELYEREKESESNILHEVIKVFKGETNYTKSIIHIKRHEILEAFSQGGNVILAQFKYVSPIYKKNSNEVVAILGSSEAKVVNKSPRYIPDEQLSKNVFKFPSL